MTPNEGLQVSEARDLITLRNKLLNQQGGGQGSSTTGALGDLNRPKRAPPTWMRDTHPFHMTAKPINQQKYNTRFMKYKVKSARYNIFKHSLKIFFKYNYNNNNI
jgi:hypothetical protein